MVAFSTGTKVFPLLSQIQSTPYICATNNATSLMNCGAEHGDSKLPYLLSLLFLPKHANSREQLLDQGIEPGRDYRRTGRILRYLCLLGHRTFAVVKRGHFPTSIGWHDSHHKTVRSASLTAAVGEYTLFRVHKCCVSKGSRKVTAIHGTPTFCATKNAESPLSYGAEHGASKLPFLASLLFLPKHTRARSSAGTTAERFEQYQNELREVLWQLRLVTLGGSS